MEQAKARKGLGRGLSALLGDEDGAPVSSGTRIETAALSDLTGNPDQPRKTFTEDDVDSLAASLREKGMLQPIVVRPNPRETTRYEIVAGERRWRAAQKAQLHEVPIIVQTLTDAEALEVALVENVQRVDLNPLEEGECYQRLMDAFNYTQEQLAATVSKSRSHIANMTRLTKLPESVRDLLRGDKITAGHARALIGHPDAATLAKEIVAEGLSVREVETRINATKPDKPQKKAASAESAPQVADADTLALQGDLSAALGAPVELKHGANGAGTLTIAYRSLDELDMICERFGVTG